jgi:hypothetical protein
MASRSSTVIISSAPIAKVGGLLTLTIAEINGTWLPFSLADVLLAPKCDSHPFGDWPPNLVITGGGTGSLLYYTKHKSPGFQATRRFCTSRMGRTTPLQGVNRE